MVRSHLTNFLNSHKFIQSCFIILTFALFSLYTVFVSLDLYNVVSASVLNSEIVSKDKDLEEIDNYSLEGTVLKLDDKEYKNIKVVFYGVSLDDDKIFFNKSSKTLVQSLPNDFGVSFLISSNFFLVFIAIVTVTVLFFVLRHKLLCVTNGVCAVFSVICVILLLIMLLSLLLLC